MKSMDWNDKELFDDINNLLLGKDNKWIVNNTTADIVNHDFKREDVLFYNFDYYYWNNNLDKPLFIFTNFRRPLNKNNRKMIKYDIYNCHLDSQGKIIAINNKITHEYEIETLKTGAISYLLTLKSNKSIFMNWKASKPWEGKP